MDDLIEIIQFVKYQFEFRGGLFLEHLLDFFWSEFSNFLWGQRVNELSKFGIIGGLLAMSLIEDTFNFLILKVLEINKLIPLVVREAVPVIFVVKVFRHLSPHVDGALSLFKHHHSGTLRLLDDGLLKGEPLRVVTEAERDSDS